MSATTRVKTDVLADLVKQAFEKSNVSSLNAISVTQALMLAEIDGRKGHGLSRIPSYSAQAQSGKVDGHATPTAKQTSTTALLIDAGHGFAYPAFDLAQRNLLKIAEKHGIAAAAITRSHHFGVAGHHVERAATSGFIALLFGNTPKAIAPWGGKSALFGTNPIAFAAPRPSEPPIIVDLALSEVARGNILKAAQKGEEIPEGWAFDAERHPTTDAKAALEGTMVPMGRAKGAALALMIEVLAGALIQANFGYEASSFFVSEGPPPGVGQLLIMISPGAFGPADRVLERIEELCQKIENEPGARLPGSKRFDLREAAKRDGINVDRDLLENIRTLAER